MRSSTPSYQFLISLSGAPLTSSSLYGATVTSWKVNGTERLFLSSKATLDGTAAVSIHERDLDALLMPFRRFVAAFLLCL